MTAPLKRQPIPFGKYLLLDRINIGGMAEVWRGKMFGAGGFERLVAIKRILPNIAEDEEFIMMFLDEAKITVQLTHANIAQVYELDKIGSSYYIAMEYVPGKDLRAIFDRCRKKGEPAPIPLSCYLVAKMCEGLDYAHRKKDGMGRDMNIVHRDVSPQNVLVSYEGEVKVIDFGIAKAAGKAVKTQAGILKGKFAYMSPEQIRGLPLDRRSDVFAIGVCLYELLTGERLFVGDSDFSVLEKVRKAEVVPPSTFNRRIPEALEKIVLKALAKDVEDRYQYASDLADDLQKFLITSDSIFSRKDLMQYMKSTFAEDVEREKLRLQEYAEVKPTEGMLAALEVGIAPAAPAAPAPIPLTSPSSAQARPSESTIPVLGAPPVLAPSGPTAAAAAASNQARRSPSLAAMPLPKLTAAAPLLSNQQEEEGGATVLVDGSEYFNDGAEPVTRPNNERPQSSTLAPGAPAGGMPEVPPGISVVGPPPVPTLPHAHPPSAVPPAQGPKIPVGQRVTGSMPAPAGQPKQPPRPPALQQSRTVQPSHPPRVEDESLALTSPLHLSARGDAPEEPTHLASAGPAPTWLQNRRMKIIAGVAAAVVLVLLGLGVVLLRGPGEGNLYIKLPKGVAQKARVNINGTDLDPSKVKQAELLEKVPAGRVPVMITAEGFETYAGTIEVKAGSEVTRFEPQMKPLLENAQLIVITDPEDAEVRINNAVVKKLGDKTGPYIGDVPVGVETAVEVRAPGHKSFAQKVNAAVANAPLKVSARLEPMQFQLMVSSDPPGARIYVGGRSMGETPRPIVVLGDAHELTLKKKCFEDAVLPLQLPAEPGGSPIEVRGRLAKQPGCR